MVVVVKKHRNKRLSDSSRDEVHNALMREAGMFEVVEAVVTEEARRAAKARAKAARIVGESRRADEARREGASRREAKARRAPEEEFRRVEEARRAEAVRRAAEESKVELKGDAE